MADDRQPQPEDQDPNATGAPPSAEPSESGGAAWDAAITTPTDDNASVTPADSAPGEAHPKGRDLADRS